ncbi:MAG: alpha-mannosidase [Phycisphaerae bacterium]|nr:alpha-mannosidase [Phycisphaerae bacterium]
MDYRIVRTKIETIRQRIADKTWPVEGWQARTADFPVIDKYAYDGPWRRAECPARFPGGKTVLLRATVNVPAGARLKDLRVAFRFREMEGMLRVDGKTRAGIDEHHPWTTLPAAGKHELLLEFMSVPRSYRNPAWLREFGQFDGAELLLVNRVVEGAYYDLHFLFDAEQSETHERRKRLLHDVLEEALLSIDLTVSREQLVADLAAMRRGIAARLDEIGTEDEGGRLCLTGHSHIDTAWLWPIRETIRKCGRTFSTAVRLMEQYPEYHFSCSQPQLYAYAKKHFPEVYAEIRKWVKRGRWETTGAMWVEADCNTTGGEALVRQMLYGVEFYRKEFGTRPRSLWLPDVFGYSGALPQILQRCGLPYFFTCKLHWQSRNPFPDHLFWWRGIDGSSVLAHIPLIPNGYNSNTEPHDLRTSWRNFLQKSEYDEVLVPFGYGDGGGGPTPLHLECAARAKDFPGLPRCRQAGAEAYLAEAARSAGELPVWDGELYLETHRGTYTTHGATKKANRRNELRYREAEIFSALASRFGDKVPTAELLDGWQTILLHQFHDILPGSSIGEVYVETLADHERIAAIGEKIIDRSLKAIAGQAALAGKGKNVCVFNSLGWSRCDVATMPVEGKSSGVSLVDERGNEVPGQVVKAGGGPAEVVFVPDCVPAAGYATFAVRSAPATSYKSSLKVSPRRLENRYYLIELNGDGAITRLLDKRYDREVVARGQVLNDLQLFQDGPEREAAWNVHDTFEKRRYPFEGASKVRVVERGPVRAVVRVTRKHRKTVIEQDITLYDRLPRIDFVTRADWRERQTMLKAAFPVDVLNTRATFEIQFGSLERATHRNTSWEQEKFEVCAQRWVDLSEAGYGVSLLNDCKYGHDVKENVLRITLLRGPESPDPTADLGHHEFTYSLLPHAGGWQEAETVRRAMELNAPMRVVPCRGRGGSLASSHSFVTVEGEGVVLEALKRAEDGRGWILRLYESHGGRGPVTVSCDLPVKSVVECNLVEEDEGKVRARGGRFTFAIKPYEIKSFRLMTK